MMEMTNREDQETGGFIFASSLAISLFGMDQVGQSGPDPVSSSDVEIPRKYRIPASSMEYGVVSIGATISPPITPGNPILQHIHSSDREDTLSIEPEKLEMSPSCFA